MAAPKKYTSEELDAAVEKYFASITRRVTVREPQKSGRKDKYGHDIIRMVPVRNSLGKEMQVTEYIVPPTVEDLCEFLHIHRSTWASYSNAKEHPEFSDTTTRARGRMRAYLQRELLTRPGKDIPGIRFALEANYGMKSKTEIELGPAAQKALSVQPIAIEEREALLRSLVENSEFGIRNAEQETEETGDTDCHTSVSTGSQ